MTLQIRSNNLSFPCKSKPRLQTWMETFWSGRDKKLPSQYHESQVFAISDAVRRNCGTIFGALPAMIRHIPQEAPEGDFSHIVNLQTRDSRISCENIFVCLINWAPSQINQGCTEKARCLIWKSNRLCSISNHHKHKITTNPINFVLYFLYSLPSLFLFPSIRKDMNCCVLLPW